MPNLHAPANDGRPRVEFVVSVPLDLLNCMSFTSLAGTSEGLPRPVLELRDRLDPALREELDFFMRYPGAEWGLLGALEDVLFLHPEAWQSVDALLDFVRAMPVEGPDASIEQMLRYAVGQSHSENARETRDLREAIRASARAAELDVEAVTRLFERPEELRARLMRLIRRFYDEHYRPDEERRRTIMERAAAARNGQPIDALEFARAVMHRDEPCLANPAERYDHLLFLPSIDMGPYMSCAAFPPLHAMIYPAEPEFLGVPADEWNAERTALVYKALADEQRLRILRILRGREMYANEIVAATGLHQSVVSRHLSFLKAVGLVNARRQNNMKFFSLNTGMRRELTQALDAVLPPEHRDASAPARAPRRERSRAHVE